MSWCRQTCRQCSMLSIMAGMLTAGGKRSFSLTVMLTHVCSRPLLYQHACLSNHLAICFAGTQACVRADCQSIRNGIPLCRFRCTGCMFARICLCRTPLIAFCKIPLGAWVLAAVLTLISGWIWIPSALHLRLKTVRSRSQHSTVHAGVNQLLCQLQPVLLSWGHVQRGMS